MVAESHRVKESSYGRLVWKNWSMEMFVRKKFDWKSLVKQQEEAYYGQPEEGVESDKKKKPIELKMEQLYKKKQVQEEKAKRSADDLGNVNQERLKRIKVRGRNR